MSRPNVDDLANLARYWRARAEEVRALREGVSDGYVRATLADIAEQYDAMARKAEMREL